MLESSGAGSVAKRVMTVGKGESKMSHSITRVTGRWWSTLMATAAVCLAVSPACAQQAEPAPATLLSGELIQIGSEFNGGLIVHAGCRDGDLLVSLATAPNVLVQGTH